ncbi:MAG: hypothetical protein KAS32_28350, partial [Candidatus Peribacteraceae bacterium]|nr:hypothetical protein [Candidatus Peribacteraceae bacterium]
MVEASSLWFASEITDNVKVSTAQVTLFVDKNLDGSFEDQEEVARRLIFSPPFNGSLVVKKIEEYLGVEAAQGVEQLALLLKFSAQDGAGNKSEVTRPVTLVRNQPPEVRKIQILDFRGYNLGDTLAEITEGRGIVVNVIASDREVGVDAVRLYQAVGSAETLIYEKEGQDEAAPFQFHVKVPAGRVGELISFKAEAIDIDGYESQLSGARGLTIKADQPPTANIIKPDNDESVIIDGQDIEVFVEAIDDLGADGIDRVVFYVNEVPVQTEYNSWSEVSGSAAQEHIYRALISPPDGAQGFVVYAVAHDVMGHTARSQTVRIGKIEDTVAPKVSVLSPIQGDILTTAKTIDVIVAVEDIGVEADRRVYVEFVREVLGKDAVEWQVVAQDEKELFRDDSQPGQYVSDPDNHYYIYQIQFVSGDIFKRGDYPNERVRSITRVVTPNHTVWEETVHEIGLPVSEQRFLLPQLGSEDLAETVYYTAVDQYKSTDQTGAFIAAWSNHDPLRYEPGIGNLVYPEYHNPDYDNEDNIEPSPVTGLFIADSTTEPPSNNGDGKYYLYSDLMTGASEIFLGTITEIHADDDFVLAGKSGLPGSYVDSEVILGSFANSLKGSIATEPETGGVYLENGSGELLIYTVTNGDNQFGLPYLLKGRVDMPYSTVYGVARQDDLVLVANGNGGVQVIDISNLGAPYHVGYIKPNGYARDVVINDSYAIIAASHEGIVVADIMDPSMPIIATLDTLGVANKLFLEGDTLYVADMSGDGFVSQLNIVDVSDPYHPTLTKTVELKPARKDLVADGVYDVTVAGGKAYATVHYSDQEDKPTQAIVEIVDLNSLDNNSWDSTVPAVTHREAGVTDIGGRGLVVARGGLQIAGA